MKKSELSICPCCGQTTIKTARQTAQRHIDMIEKAYGVTFKEIRSKTKTFGISYARSHFWFNLVIEDNWSMPRAADKTGHKYHAVLYGVRRIGQDLLGTDPKAPVNDIRRAYWTAMGLSPEQVEEKIPDR